MNERRPNSFLALLTALFMWGCADDSHRDPIGADAGPDATDVGETSGDASAPDAGSESDADANSAIPLVDHGSWQPLDAAADPFEDRPADIECDPQAYGMELIDPEETFFVKTQGCEYVTVKQPLAESISQGDVITIRVWHYDLTAPAASEAHLALRAGEQTIWEEYIAIPSDSGLLMDTWTAPQDIPAGDDIFFHVHNHGNNEYNLIEVSLQQ